MPVLSETLCYQNLVMAAKTDFSKDTLTEILANYSLGQYKDSKLFTTGTVQTNILLETTVGKFVFIEYLDFLGNKEFYNELFD